MLADIAPELSEALRRARDEGFSHVILDGTVIACDRCKEPAISVRGEVIDLWYSGKAHAHGGNIQAVTAPDGFPLWVSDAEPGSVPASPPPAPTPCRLSTRQPPRACPRWPALEMTRGYRHPDSCQTARGRRGTLLNPVPATPSSARCAAWASEGSPCSPVAGVPSATSPPAPAKSAILPAPPSSSPILRTATSHEFR